MFDYLKEITREGSRYGAAVVPQLVLTEKTAKELRVLIRVAECFDLILDDLQNTEDPELCQYTNNIEDAAQALRSI